MRGEGQVLPVPPPGRSVDVRSADGTRLAVTVHGADDVPTIVLVHGILCATDFWRFQIADLAGDFRVVSYDHRGHGRSEAPRAGNYSLDHLADDLSAVLAATVPTGARAVIAGHSMGGIAILAWARRYPDEVERYASAAALVNTTSGDILDNVNFLRGPTALLRTRSRLARAALPAARLPMPRRLPMRRLLLTRVAIGAGADPRLAYELDTIIAGTSARGRGGYGALLVRMDATIDPAALTVPTAVIAGSRDRITPVASAQAIAVGLPQLTALHEFVTGHCGPWEEPAAVSGVLRGLASASTAEIA
ncbi:alpha/beta hydrolase [Gordonia sp. ABSL1-1]|uniref:alpha/beta fold hydrolase n=1 Tax=Gordonia sp. ABSL1-1 TaxID=3053923 RepID=UPI002573223C|nr:alpha/beta hydrolase [Gordonia sp. ABSL1-1]MDL9936833.1 alpha/beta hydrolase [Gordonia sp. ABSL1-1]